MEEEAGRCFAIMEKNEFNLEVLFFPVTTKPTALYSSSEHNGMEEVTTSYIPTQQQWVIKSKF